MSKKEAEESCEFIGIKGEAWEFPIGSLRLLGETAPVFILSSWIEELRIITLFLFPLAEVLIRYIFPNCLLHVPANIHPFLLYKRKKKKIKLFIIL